MKTALIILLGNRDIQIHESKYNDLKAKYAQFLSHNEKEGYYVVDKYGAAQHKKSFFEISELFWQDYDYLINFFEFPLWQKTIDSIDNEINKIFISTSNQNPPNKQDCAYFAYILKKYLESKKFDVEIKFSESNPTDFESMFNFYSELFNSIEKDFDKLIISNTGGTPQMRTASHFAGLFRFYDYIAISASDNSSPMKTFQQQETLILYNIVEKMLNTFDYEGINNLPIQNDEIKNLSNYAIARIALNHCYALKFIEDNIAFENENKDFYQNLKDEINYNFGIRDLERETFLSANIKFKQKSYGDYLWRLFTIHENMSIPIIEQALKTRIDKKMLKNKPDYTEWNEVLHKYPELIEYLKSKKIGKSELNWTVPNRIVFSYVSKWIFKKGLLVPHKYFNDIFSCLENLKDLRNDIAHNYEGIGLNNIEECLPKKITLEFFNEMLGEYIGIKWNSIDTYNRINKKILDLLK